MRNWEFLLLLLLCLLKQLWSCQAQPVSDPAFVSAIPTCPLTFNGAEMERAAWGCQKAPGAEDCCNKVITALQGARARWAAKTEELFVAEEQAQACLREMQVQLTARGLSSETSVAVTGLACSISTAELVVRFFRAGVCGNYTTTSAVTSALTLKPQDFLGSDCSDPLRNCSQCLDAIGRQTLVEIPDTGLLYKEECVRVAKLAIQANASFALEPLLGQCFWDTVSVHSDCNWIRWSRVNFTAAINGCRNPQDCTNRGQCGCCNVLLGLIGLETTRVASINGTTIMPPDQASACAQDFARQLDLQGLNSTFLVKDCGLGPADFGQQQSCANLISVEDFRNASDNFAVSKAYCSPDNCSASCQDQVIGVSQALGVSQAIRYKLALDRRLVENCVRWLNTAFASRYQSNTTALTSSLNCFINLSEDTLPRLNTTTLQLEAEQAANQTRAQLPSSSGGTGFDAPAAVGAVVGGVVGLALIGGFLYLIYQRRRKGGGSKRGGKRHPLFASLKEASSGTDSGPVWYTYSQLKAATNGFNSGNIIGKGGSGRVYKGQLPNGQVVAVKELMHGATEKGEKEFVNEALVINSVRHKNLVLLRGCCVKDHHRLLVYDYMPNGNIDQFLHGVPKQTPLGPPQQAEASPPGLINDWGLRFNLAVGTARGLAYLHEDVKPRIIHRDVKPSNILLDGNMEALVADFGLAKLTAEELTHVSTGVVGTWGYLAPEYAASGHLTDKSDVYSYGVVLLELVAGRRPVRSDAPPDEIYLVEWAWSLAEQGTLIDLVDPRLRPLGETDSVLRAIKVGLLAVHTAVVHRPTMSQCVRMLLGVEAIPPLPSRPVTLFTIASSATDSSGLTRSTFTRSMHGTSQDLLGQSPTAYE